MRLFLAKNWQFLVLLAAIGSWAAYDHRYEWGIVKRPARTTKIDRQAGAVTSSSLEVLLGKSGPPVVPTAPALGQDPANVRSIPRDWLYTPPAMPQPNTDVLAVIGVKLVNEFNGDFGVTDDAIRGTADLSYGLLGIADKDLKGWELVVRPGNGVANTQMMTEQRRAVIQIDPSLVPTAFGHEMTHFLAGKVTADNLVPGFISEFIAEAAEINGKPPAQGPDIFDYDRLNRPILGISTSLSGVVGKIGADSPLDGFRYDLMRLGAAKIGAEKHRAVATQIWQAAEKADKPLSLADVKPYFDEAGLGDCVLFTETTEPGVYVDIAVSTDGVPFIFYKQVDNQGVETSLPANLRLTWRKGEQVLANYNGATNEAGIFVDSGMFTVAPYADMYEVTIGTQTWAYRLDGNAPEMTVTPKAVAHSL